MNYLGHDFQYGTFTHTKGRINYVISGRRLHGSLIISVVEHKLQF